ncbi:TolC family protein [Marinimicrobium sp. ABcell2]|uniref:TolC family protein n=1 Tax=Marinimicrobium sp. ABcell2 TaxID=3069751 RepID=UPI0027B063A5|nr:TolC family protein [Marinimicrobium sp. ABcell2]MDQ2077087.1 TolC family protein [Marinimicrobium sp. ABcell2]
MPLSGKTLAIIGASALLAVGCTSPGPWEPPSAADDAPGTYALTQPLADDAGLEELLSFALAQHPRIAAAEAEWRAVEAQITRAGALEDPRLSVSQSLSGDRQRLAVEQAIPLFGRRGLARDAAHHEALASQAQWHEAQLDVQQELVRAYAEYGYVLASENIVRQQQALLEQLLEVVRVRYQVGGANQAELLRMQSEADQLTSELQQRRQLRVAAGAQLNAALGRPSSALLPEPVWSPLPIVPESTALALEPLSANPRLQALEHQREARRADWQTADRSGRPQLMVGLEYMRDPAMGGDTSVMAGMTLPVWRGTYQAEREQAQERYRATTERLRDEQQQLEAALQMALFNFRDAERNRRLYGEQLIPRTEQALQATRAAYSAGNAAFADLIASQRDWLGFQLSHERARADTLIWQAEIAMLAGILLVDTGDTP